MCYRKHLFIVLPHVHVRLRTLYIIFRMGSASPYTPVNYSEDNANASESDGTYGDRKRMYLCIYFFVVRQGVYMDM